jgi:predicted permease
MALDPKTQGYSPEKTKRFFRQLESRVSELPGVQSMSYSDIAPLSLASHGDDYYDAETPNGKQAQSTVFQVGPKYFETMGIPLLRGRDFNPQKDENMPVALINVALAKQLFGDRDPLGRHVREGRDTAAAGKVYEVIGLVGNSKSQSLGEEGNNCVFRYLPSHFDQTISLLGITVMVKTSGDAASLLHPLRKAVESVDRDMPVFNLQTMARHLDNALMLPRVCATLFGTFGGIGLVLAAVGLYGVVSYSVRARTREIGIRMALGARAVSVALLVARQGLMVVAMGLAVGLAMALALSRVLGSLLYGVGATDLITFVGVPLIFVSVAAVAIALPAWRAARIEPMSALRYD